MSGDREFRRFVVEGLRGRVSAVLPAFSEGRPTWSTARRIPAPAPRGEVLLTGLQWAIEWFDRRPHRGPVTLQTYADFTGSSRGACHRAKVRLRYLGLQSWRAYPYMDRDPERRDRRGRRRLRSSPGCRGRILTWHDRAAREARRAARERRRQEPIDSAIAPYGRYLSARGLAESWRRRHPPGSAGRGGLAGPHRGPPPVLWARCPAGHTVHIAARSWREGPAWEPSLRARFDGSCRRCGADVAEEIRIEPRYQPPRPLSEAELADPELRAARETAAGALVDEAATAPGILAGLRRDYLTPRLSWPLPESPSDDGGAPRRPIN